VTVPLKEKTPEPTIGSAKADPQNKKAAARAKPQYANFIENLPY
jgi:hypothetical protein